MFIDFLVFFAAWIAFGVAFASAAVFYALGFLFIVDVALTSSHGLSIGRWVALELVHFHLRGSVPTRMWWDAAAGTRLMSAKAVPSG